MSRAVEPNEVLTNTPPVLGSVGHGPELLDLPAGVLLGVAGLSGVPFEATFLDLRGGDQLVLYTDGLVETRDQALDDRLDLLLSLLTDPSHASGPRAGRPDRPNVPDTSPTPVPTPMVPREPRACGVPTSQLARWLAYDRRTPPDRPKRGGPRHHRDRGHSTRG